ncbi:prepilin peptidase [Butyrivibrio sp. X503]|uniref:prepilin peptidase n=1 Tax=Butyrivibrio sp. X503 TaxID=2364878 RepID=UPI000EA97ECD|nr:A24 family peptidase [Butyrivibrio sp. X503]RKM56325.1 prepilin peptidase [Butyrivibrio sp. X503]
MIIYFGVVTFIFGLALGSFLNCMAMRIVRKEDWVKGKSHCMHCGHELGAPDLVPVFSYIFSGGKCRYCKQKVSVRYPLTELLFGLLCLGLYIAFWDNIILLITYIILTACLFAASLVDLEIMEIPNGCIIVGVITFIVSKTAQYLLEKDKANIPGILENILSCVGIVVIMVAIALLMGKVLKRDALGGGDIKLYGMLALYLGAAGSYELILLSCIIGLLFVGIRRRFLPDKTREFPFAPAIAMSGYILLIFSKTVTDWYFSLF